MNTLKQIYSKLKELVFILVALTGILIGLSIIGGCNAGRGLIEDTHLATGWVLDHTAPDESGRRADK